MPGRFIGLRHATTQQVARDEPGDRAGGGQDLSVSQRGFGLQAQVGAQALAQQGQGRRITLGGGLMLGVSLALHPRDALDHRLLASRAQGGEGRGIHLLPRQVVQPHVRVGRLLARVEGRPLRTRVGPLPAGVIPAGVQRLAAEVMLDQVDVARHAGRAEATHEADFRTEFRGTGGKLGLAGMHRLESLPVPEEHARHHRAFGRRELRQLTQPLHVGLAAQEIDGDRGPLGGAEGRPDEEQADEGTHGGDAIRPRSRGKSKPVRDGPFLIAEK